MHASWRTFDGGRTMRTLLVAARTLSNFSTMNSASLSALMSVETDTVEIDENNRQSYRGHTIFDLNGRLL